MTDVLLAHSYHLPHDAKQLRKMQPYPPLGTLYAATALRAAGIPVAVFDPMLAEPISGFAEMLRLHAPRIVVIYEDDFNFVTKMCLAHMRGLAQQLARMAADAGAIVVAHGSDATDNAGIYFLNGVDYVLVGEAEQTLTTLCERILSGQEISIIPGMISSKSDRAITHAEAMPKNPGWICLPRIARDLIDMEPYRKAWQSAHGYFSTNIVASRGCPYGCKWCAKPISGNKFQVREPKDVVGEIWELKHVHHVQHIWFGDDIFALNHRWIEEFAHEMQARDCILPFKIQSRADLMTDSVVDALRRAGCAEVWMGVESGSQEILNAMGKGLRISSVREARARLANAGVRACYFLQFGYPGEGWQEILETLDFVRSTHPDDIGVSVSYPLPGTRFHELVQEQLGAKRNWSDSDDLCGLFTTAYTDEFYRSLRDLLHAEVDSWQATASVDPEVVRSLWRRVCSLEPTSHNTNALRFDTPVATSIENTFVPLQQLLALPAET